MGQEIPIKAGSSLWGFLMLLILTYVLCNSIILICLFINSIIAWAFTDRRLLVNASLCRLFTLLIIFDYFSFWCWCQCFVFVCQISYCFWNCTLGSFASASGLSCFVWNKLFWFIVGIRSIFFAKNRYYWTTSIQVGQVRIFVSMFQMLLCSLFPSFF